MEGGLDDLMIDRYIQLDFIYYRDSVADDSSFFQTTNILPSPGMSMWWRIGALSGMCAVALGAFGSHGLRSKQVSQRELEIWDTAVRYQFYHALAILLTVSRGAGNVRLPSALFTAGTIIFSGSLYALVLTGEKRLGAITPIGGTLLIGGWLALAMNSSV